MDPAIIKDFRTTVAEAASRFLSMSENQASKPLAAGKWSPKEVIGHLIDSASNNHSRFVRGQLPATPLFAKYDQDGWVRAQRYQDRKWSDLVTLWQVYNEHLAWIMETADRAMLDREFAAPEMDQLLWKTQGDGRIPTLRYFMTDYIVHLKHHLRQVPTPASTA